MIHNKSDIIVVNSGKSDIIVIISTKYSYAKSLVLLE